MSNALFPSKVKGLTFTVLKTMEWSSIVQKASSGDTLRLSQYLNPIWHFELIYDYVYDTYYSPNNTQAYAPYTDLQALMGFIGSRQGQYDDFLFLDDTDYSASGMRSGVWSVQTVYPLGTVVIDRNGHAQLVTTAGTSGTSYPAFSATGGVVVDGSVTWTDQGYWPTGFPDVPLTLSVVNDGNGNYYSPIQRNCGGFLEDVTDLVSGTLNLYTAGSPAAPGTYTVAGPGLALPGSSYAGMYVKWAAAPPQPVTATFHFYFRLRFEEDTQDFERWAQGLWTIGGSQAKNGNGYIKLVTSRPPTSF